MADTPTLPERLRTLDTAATPAPWPPPDDVEVRGEDEGLILALRNNVPEILAAFDAAERLARIRAQVEQMCGDVCAWCPQPKHADERRRIGTPIVSYGMHEGGWICEAVRYRDVLKLFDAPSAATTGDTTT